MLVRWWLVHTKGTNAELYDSSILEGLTLVSRGAYIHLIHFHFHPGIDGRAAPASTYDAPKASSIILKASPSTTHLRVPHHVHTPAMPNQRHHEQKLQHLHNLDHRIDVLAAH
jgi:hypothetical protein